MIAVDLIDELYAAFAAGLGGPLARAARDLPRALGLTPELESPWSRVFSHDVTLGAPALFAQAMPGVSGALVREAVLAHLLAVIHAFGTDRIEDGQIDVTPAITAVLERARVERDRAMGRLFGGRPPTDVDFAASDAMTAHAIKRERALLLSARAVDLPMYERASLDKQCAGLLASVGLAHVAGWSDRRVHAVRAALASVALGLQAYDDVVDWEDDLRRGGSWAVCLLTGLQQLDKPSDRRTASVNVRGDVLRSGVLRMLLARARHHLRAARRRALALGVDSLAAWAASRETRLEAVLEAETKTAGYAVRAHALAAWAGEVLT